MMNPPREILDFHIIRTTAHVASVGYFARLLGRDFPDHDIDKFSEPMRTPYAFLNYKDYHPEFDASPEMVESWQLAQRAHHATAPHHEDSYSSMALMTDDKITEMVCDWFSASYEKTLIRDENKFSSVLDFYRNDSARQHAFTNHQDELILSLIDDLEYRMNVAEFMKIWKDLCS